MVRRDIDVKSLSGAHSTIANKITLPSLSFLYKYNI